ncbi:MAG: phosphate ABC transporter substrate-binding protein [Agathobacter sp.]|nr:phosphate ABC transporter substrate-binding protein [Agathobacter sp.]
MKNKITKTLGILAAATLLMGSFAGCGNSASTEGNDASNDTTAEASADDKDAESLSGTISLAGSTSMEKVCESLMEGFMEKYSDITVTTEYTGSGAGLEALAAGSIDIGNSSRHVKEEESSNGLVENVIALDGIAVIVDVGNSTVELTSDQLAQIYKGELTNWSELGGADEAIVVIGRESGSGTRDAFEELLEVADECKYAQELDSTGAVLAKVASTPGAIGYVSLDVVDDTVNTIVLDGSAPTEEEILAGNYKLSRPFVMATKGEISNQSDLVQTWFDYINSAEGQEIIKGAGLILPN